MEQDTTKKLGHRSPKHRLGSSHDHFAKLFMQYEAIASDLLEFYADPVVSEYVDVHHLQPAPTHGISDELKEVIMDVSFIARLRDTTMRSEVLFALEHKSSPSPMVALQVGTQAFLALYTVWTKAGYTDAKNFDLPFPIMIVLYHGAEDWAAKEIQFQDLYKNIPEKLRHLIPRFVVLVINLRRFRYGNLPGRPITRAFVESLMRATDGTFAANLGSIFQHIRDAGLDEPFKWDFLQAVSSYCSRNDVLTVDILKQTILKIFEGQEAIEMLKTIPNGIFQDGIMVGLDRGRVEGRVEGRAEGEVIARIDDIVLFLEDRFGAVPELIITSLKTQTDVTVLRSLLLRAATCDSMADFSKAMK